MKSWMVGALALLGLAVSTPGRAQSQPEVSWTVGVAGRDRGCGGGLSRGGWAAVRSVPEADGSEVCFG